VLVFGAPIDEVMAHPDYPVYFTRILGFWELLGAIALLAPRFPRLKEWAYAGIFFEMTGAAASRAANGDNAAHLVAPLMSVGGWRNRNKEARLDFGGRVQRFELRNILKECVLIL
jgi:uncharacterized membrane protein YphA (DoxX/SURF4 family)